MRSVLVGFAAQGSAWYSGRMSEPVAALFRVRLEYLKQEDPKDDPASDGTCHKSLNVVARDAEAAVASARTHVLRTEPGRVRRRSVEFIDSIDVAQA